ncbi:MAG: hypothetical protein HC905_16345 [Bacteroidales bacterium]|nr:hypothetical protein [Bacteroidales bacterium]
MKQLIILIILFAWTTSSGLHSQTIADTLEMAYNHFNNKEYQKAVTHFDYFLSKVTGQSKDYYLAGVCKANLGASEKSMDYLNKAANGIAEYHMMKNDPGLKAVQGQINEIISRFDNFNKAYKLVMEQYPSKKSTLFAADSLYHLLPSGKIPKKQLKAIAYEFLSQAKDTFRFFYYLTEQLKTYQGKDRGKDIVKELQSSVKTYKNKIGKTTLGKLLEMGEFRYFYAMSFAGNIDSLRYHLSKVPYNVSMSCMPEDSYLLSFEYFTEQGQYNHAFSYLYSALASGHLTTKKFSNRRLVQNFLISQ